jgi:hypothetical protein
MTFDEFRNHLENVRENADGSITAKCPGHADRVSSLCARRGVKVEIVAFCFASCDFTRILRGAEFSGARRGVKR